MRNAPIETIPTPGSRTGPRLLPPDCAHLFTPQVCYGASAACQPRRGLFTAPTAGPKRSCHSHDRALTAALTTSAVMPVGQVPTGAAVLVRGERGAGFGFSPGPAFRPWREPPRYHRALRKIMSIRTTRRPCRADLTRPPRATCSPVPEDGIKDHGRQPRACPQTS